MFVLLLPSLCGNIKNAVQIGPQTSFSKRRIKKSQQYWTTRTLLFELYFSLIWNSATQSIELMMRKLRINERKYFPCILGSHAIEFSEADKTSQIIWLDIKIEEIALFSFIAFVAIIILIKQKVNSSFASWYIDMLIVCKDKCVLFWSQWDLCSSVKTEKWLMRTIDTYNKGIDQVSKLNLCDK